MQGYRCSVLRRIALTGLIALGATSLAFAGGHHAGGHDVGHQQADGHESGDHHHGDEGAIGVPGVAADADRTVTIIMSDDFRFTPSQFTVEHGETVRLLVENKGRLTHEITLGTQAELLEHLELMKKFPSMEHDEPNSITLQPGEKGEIVWRFTQPGEVDFGCLIPGHYEAGMKGAIQVGAD